jgi:2,3-bisphosphoglycerate-independent phosphoglycerate mutase
MKYLIVVPDGSADRPSADYGGRTPLEDANIPNINSLAAHGEVGFVRTIPEGIAPGSDAANLAVMGYDPAEDLTGRSPLEAVSMGIDMSEDDVAFRTNLVTLKGDAGAAYEDLTIVDHSSGDITNAESEVLVKYIDENIGSGDPKNSGRLKFYPGVSYRHALIVQPGEPTESGIGDVSKEADGYVLTPPHDILEKRIGDYLPKGEGSEYLLNLMKKSYELLKDYSVNIARQERGLNPASSIWVWGQGKKPNLASFGSKFGIDGSVISAVDLIKGIGLCAGLSSIDVEGATGLLDTNFKGKADAAISAFESGKDFIYIHVEAPDECSHQGNRATKIQAIESIDHKIVAPVVEYLAGSGEDYKILIVPDHRTPVEIRTHSDEPVPYVIYDSTKANLIDKPDSSKAFSEKSAESGRSFGSGKELAEYFFGE